jgi:LmbE family N-acetylglucosaminyl deacetylase
VFKSLFEYLRQLGSKYKKIIIVIFIIWGLFTFGLGNLIGWLFIPKETLGSFPQIKQSDRILIVAPHIDDEVIGSGGLIQQALQIGAQIKIIYMTNGDNNLYAVVTQDRSLKTTPREFIGLGQERMQEGINATKVLGLSFENLIFLGYPDRGLSLMFNKYYSEPYTSRGTGFSFNPYSGTFKKEQPYTGSNVLSDLGEIIDSFKPSIVIVSHPRDIHPDHSATYSFMEKVLTEKSFKGKLLTYLVHYSTYPLDERNSPYLYPPKRLFTQNGWISLDLTSDQESKKLLALNQNKSQLEFIDKFIRGFVKRNEIFEEMN